MKARILKDDSGSIKLLCADGTILDADSNKLRYFAERFRDAAAFSGENGKWTEFSKDMAMYPGRTLAYVSDDLCLVAVEPEFIPSLFTAESEVSYIGLVEYAKKVDRSEQIIKVLCRSGRLTGAKKIGGRWMIPENVPYPVAPSRRHDNS